MWKCHKCGKPVYFAERKQSLGYDWHPECLRCEECGKRLNPGQHAEHKGVPYCHVPCYGALFGPQLFGHGTRVESHKSFGQQKESPKVGNGPVIPRSQIETKLKCYNQFYDGKSGEVRSREVNGRLVLEGSLKIHWGVQGVIHLKEDDDQRTVVTVRKRNSCRMKSSADYNSDEDIDGLSRDNSFNDISISSINSNVDLESSVSSLNLETISMSNASIESSGDIGSATSTAENSPVSPVHDALPKSSTLPPKLNLKNMEWDELDELLQVERKVDNSDKLYQTMPAPLPSQTESSQSEILSIVKDSINGNLDENEPPNPLQCDNQEEDNQQKEISEPHSDNLAPETSPNKIEESQDDSWVELGNHLNRSMSGPDCLERIRHPKSPEFDQISVNSASVDVPNQEEVVIRRPPKTGATAIKRRPGKRLSRTKIKRRCSINGHFYNRETSFFTPPHGSQMSVWVTSLVNTQEVVNLILEKYKVDSDANNFALFVVRDNGGNEGMITITTLINEAVIIEQRRLKDEEYPLLVRVLQGPHEDVVRLFLMDSHSTPEVSSEVAQFLNLSPPELRAILNQYYSQEEKEVARVQEKFSEMKRRIKQRMEELKVRL